MKTAVRLLSIGVAVWLASAAATGHAYDHTKYRSQKFANLRRPVTSTE